MNCCFYHDIEESGVGGWGGGQFEHHYYTPLYNKGIKEIENKPMETT